MLYITGIANLKLAGNVLAAEHCSSQCSVIKTDPRAGA